MDVHFPDGEAPLTPRTPKRVAAAAGRVMMRKITLANKHQNTVQLLKVWRKRSSLDRRLELSKIYSEFDLDGNGDVGEAEMFALGTARRKLGQKSSTWSKDQTHTMMLNMDCDADNNVSSGNFVAYFISHLSKESDDEFLETMEQFLACARSLRPQS